MANYQITVTNRVFQSRNTQELPTRAAATKQGLSAALTMGAEEVAQGEPYFGAEVCIEDDDGRIDRFVVSVGASPIQDAPL